MDAISHEIITGVMSEQIQGRLAILACISPRSDAQEAEVDLLHAELRRRNIEPDRPPAEFQEREIAFYESEVRWAISQLSGPVVDIGGVRDMLNYKLSGSTAAPAARPL